MPDVVWFGGIEDVDGLLHARQFEPELELTMLPDGGAGEDAILEEQRSQSRRQQDGINARDVDSRFFVEEAVKGIGTVVRPPVGALLEPSGFDPSVFPEGMMAT